MKLKITGLCAAILLALVLPVSAQDDLPLAGHWREIAVESDGSDCFGAESTTDETSTEEAEDIIVTFGVYDDGDTLVGVRGLEDFLFTRSDDGTYEGSFLAILSDGYEYHSTLTVESPTEMTSVSETIVFECTITSTVRYERLEGDGSQLWTETAREVLNTSLLGECLGRTLITPPVWVTMPDFMVAVRVDEAAGTAYFNGDEYVGSGGSFARVEDTSDDPYLPTVETYTLEIISDEALTHSLASISYEREDCQIAYSGTFVPFDGDFEALNTFITETLEAIEAP
jgi:hypothetical protein